MNRINPWLSKSNLKTLINQQIINDITNLDIKELASKFKKLYVLTLSDNFNNDEILKTEISEETYNNIKKNIVLRLIPFSVLKNDFVRNFMTIININDLNKDDFEDENILVISLLNISNYSVDCFTKQYTGLSSLNDFVHLNLINDYLQKDINNEINKSIRCALINNIAESNYWTYNCNTKLNITLKFISRGFNLNISQRLEDKSIKDVIEKISSKSEEDNDYLSFLFKKNAYVDAAASIEKNGYMIYRINQVENDITKEEFNCLLKNFINKN
jgi:hypothetical protein